MYNYQTQRANLFTESGQVMFLKIRDKVHQLLQTAGAFRMDKAISGCTGEGWNMLACVDRLIELGEIKEVTKGDVAGQDRIFTYKD